MKELLKKVGAKIFNVAVVLIFKFLRTKASMDKLRKMLDTAKESERLINEKKKEIEKDVEKTKEEIDRMKKEVERREIDDARNRLKDFVNGG